jgi:precorrin-2 dehydrogenase/sirohydrochlorin ferrochelatase
MPDLPVMLKLAGRRCVIVGGGAVALRRARALLEAGAEVTVIAPRIGDELAGLAVRTHRRAYQDGDLAGAFLAVVATDDPAANRAAGQEAARLGVLCNRADDPEAGDLVVPAHVNIGLVTIVVGSGGISPRAAAVIRDQLAVQLDRDWSRLLEIVEPFRAELQQRVEPIERRRRALHELTDPAAMVELKEKGAEAFKAFCRRVVESAASEEPSV